MPFKKLWNTVSGISNYFRYQCITYFYFIVSNYDENNKCVLIKLILIHWNTIPYDISFAQELSYHISSLLK